jgi:hypothetical protein
MRTVAYCRASEMPIGQAQTQNVSGAVPGARNRRHRLDARKEKIEFLIAYRASSLRFSGKA